MEIKCKHDITWHNMTWHDITDITCVLGNQTFLLVNKLLCGPVDLNIGQSVPMGLILDLWITYQRFLANDFWFFVTLFPFDHLAILPWLLLTIHAAFHLKMISVILASLWYVKPKSKWHASSASCVKILFLPHKWKFSLLSTLPQVGVYDTKAEKQRCKKLEILEIYLCYFF